MRSVKTLIILLAIPGLTACVKTSTYKSAITRLSDSLTSMSLQYQYDYQTYYRITNFEENLFAGPNQSSFILDPIILSRLSGNYIGSVGKDGERFMLSIKNNFHENRVYGVLREYPKYTQPMKEVLIEVNRNSISIENLGIGYIRINSAELILESRNDNAVSWHFVKR